MRRSTCAIDDTASGSLAPLPLLPYAVETTAGLLIGELDIVTTIDVGAIERRFAERGINAAVACGPSAADGFLTASRGTASLSVPATVRKQISIELMTIETLVEMVDWTIDDVASSDAHQPEMIIDYAG